MARTAEQNDRARRAALAVLEEPLPRSNRFVSYESRGCILLAGPPAPVLELANRLRQHLQVVAVIDGAKPMARYLGMTVLTGRVRSLHGYLGRFSAQAQSLDKRSDEGPDAARIDLATRSSNEDGFFDVVIDLSETPLIDRELPPPGYFRPTDADGYQAMIDAIPTLLGETRKRKYFEFLPGRCIHRRQQVAGCDRCLQVCPAQAIVPAEHTIEVDPYLCQGCGSCTLVCPTGALIYVDPALSDIADRISRTLHAFRSAQGVDAWLGLHAGDPELLLNWARRCGITLLPLAVPSVTALGLEPWLLAIALGASGVAVFIDDTVPATTVTTLRRQFELTREILEALGHPQERLWLLDSKSIDTHDGDIADVDGIKDSPPWSYDPALPDPRERLLSLFKRLSAAGDRDPSPKPKDLAQWANFGRVTVDNNACTMCLACVSLCPTDALHASDDRSELRFHTAACVQCGLCEHGCPENAIRRQPQFDVQSLLRREPVVLNRTKLATCSECGRPFMPATLLAAAAKRISGDSATVRHAKAMLNVCPACRADHTLRAQFPSATKKS